MTTAVIEDSSVQAEQFFDFVRTLPFATVGVREKSFEKAVAECNGISVTDFTDELRRQIDEYFDKHA
ncbi:MAG: hypothetical protein FWF09_08590 [Bacteroidales bacterium]|nr:hypothetical protein [Bacteroidales bacterium]